VQTCALPIWAARRARRGGRARSPEGRASPPFYRRSRPASTAHETRARGKGSALILARGVASLSAKEEGRMDAAGRRRRGFTLVELMVVVAILGLLASLVAVKALRMLGQARRRQAQADLVTVDRAIALFHLDTGIWPERLEDLVAPGAPEWHGPY